MSPAVEIWAWSGCPSHEAAGEQLATALGELGFGDVPVGVRWVETDEEAERLGFVGSPTVVVDGRDVLPPPPGTPPSLTCRIYHHRDGRVSPLPDPYDLRDALGSALTARTG
jgi:hypothetical protein